MKFFLYGLSIPSEVTPPSWFGESFGRLFPFFPLVKILARRGKSPINDSWQNGTDGACICGVWEVYVFLEGAVWISVLKMIPNSREAQGILESKRTEPSCVVPGQV